ncbi:hypothetical protein SKAU_G00264950 [Synaphobranchus kaupii]|uniref:Uncharacterized protein n=1 Tax=Synaphobranchus kaupii TaxID=118154 RepID=A0A9Q1EZG6_SYNKA|nr:hypothetical protein SKAU_G00264950 [Synaphobranchus kaupii]
MLARSFLPHSVFSVSQPTPPGPQVDMLMALIERKRECMRTCPRHGESLKAERGRLPVRSPLAHPAPWPPCYCSRSRDRWDWLTVPYQQIRCCMTTQDV